MSDVQTSLKLEHDGTVLVRSFQDVQDIIDNNKRLQSVEQKSDWGRHIGSVPNNIAMQWLHDEWARGNVNMRFMDEEFRALMRRKLNDHDWLFLRTDL